MKDFWQEPKIKTINKKKIITSILISITLILILIISITYINNKQFREWFDTTIFRKEVEQNKLAMIELKEEDNPKVYAFDQYLGILNKNEFVIYSSTAKEEKKIPIEISNPIFASNGRYLTISENRGQKIYYITDKNITWEKNIEGNISQVVVSKNGYIAISMIDSTNKTIILVLNEKGELLFKTFISTQKVSDITISNDNKYLAIAQINTSGIVIESKVEVISIEKAKTNPKDSEIEKYKFENNELITNVQYQEKNRLLCMSKDRVIKLLPNGKQEEISNNKNKKTTFQTIELNKDIALLEEKTTNLFSADTIVTIKNTENKNTKDYKVKSVTKEIYTYDNIIALNLGNQLEFINTSGWLVKRYNAKQEITNITLSGNLAGIIYRDKIEIVNL